MDPNLQFRFAVPGWIGVIAFVSVSWAAQAPWFRTLVDQPNMNQAVIAAVAAFLAGPSVGFLLNTIVITACHLFKAGPEHGACLRRFQKRVQEACASGRIANNPRLGQVLGGLQLPAVTAHFEYRTDPEPMLGWRRRQRAAFFADWSTVLAIILGGFAGLLSGGPEWVVTSIVFAILLATVSLTAYCYPCRTLNQRHGMWAWRVRLRYDAAWIVGGIVAAWTLWLPETRVIAIVFGLLVWCLARLAYYSEMNAEQQQMIWVESWTDDEIAEFLTKYGTGFYEFPERAPGPSPTKDRGHKKERPPKEE